MRDVYKFIFSQLINNFKKDDIFDEIRTLNNKVLEAELNIEFKSEDLKKVFRVDIIDFLKDQYTQNANKYGLEISDTDYISKDFFRYLYLSEYVIKVLFPYIYYLLPKRSIYCKLGSQKITFHVNAQEYSNFIGDTKILGISIHKCDRKVIFDFSTWSYDNRIKKIPANKLDLIKHFPSNKDFEYITVDTENKIICKDIWNGFYTRIKLLEDKGHNCDYLLKD